MEASGFETLLQQREPATHSGVARKGLLFIILYNGKKMCTGSQVQRAWGSCGNFIPFSHKLWDGIWLTSFIGVIFKLVYET